MTEREAEPEEEEVTSDDATTHTHCYYYYRLFDTQQHMSCHFLSYHAKKEKRKETPISLPPSHLTHVSYALLLFLLYPAFSSCSVLFSTSILYSTVLYVSTAQISIAA